MKSGVVSSHNYPDPATAAVSRSILMILANKHKFQTDEAITGTVHKQAEAILTQSGGDEASMLDTATSIFAVGAGMLRRYNGDLAQGVLSFMRNSPKSQTLGQHLARRLEMVVAPQKILTKANYAIVKILWMQMAYVEIVQPIIPRALGQDPEVQDRVIKTNFSVAVLLLVKHMKFSIYEEDAEKILRIALSVAQTVGSGPDVAASLDVIQNILLEASDKIEEHLGSIISICTSTFSRKEHVAPEWLPKGYASGAGDDAESHAVSGKLALEITGALPKIFESRHLLPLAPKVDRELTLACGNTVRDLRQSARTARLAWKEMR